MKTANHNRNKTHCSKGHEYTSDNTSYTRNNRNGSIARKCKACASMQKRDYYLKVRREKIVKNLDFEGHGEFGTRLYKSWAKMKQRCSNPNDRDFALYGGRGISICNEWRDYKSFSRWAKYNGYRDNLTLDRINNDGNYEPSNCRWATAKEQANNRRSNHLITYNRVTKTLQQWSDEIGIETATLRYRLKTWESVDKAFTTPLMENK